MKDFIEKIAGGLIVSCYAGSDLYEEMASPEIMTAVAKSCLAGGANAIRTNYENVKMIADSIEAPLIGIKKVYRSGGIDGGDFRITPTLKEVEQLVNAGVDAVAIDGTFRERYDNLTLADFIKEIKTRWDIHIIADISTVEEGIEAYKAGADLVGTTLSGYTPYSKNPIHFGSIPEPDPDYEIIRELRNAGVNYVIAEGRISDGNRMRKALQAGAHAVVIGTSITQPKKIVRTILSIAKEEI